MKKVLGIDELRENEDKLIYVHSGVHKSNDKNAKDRVISRGFYIYNKDCGYNALHGDDYFCLFANFRNFSYSVAKAVID